ncbi:hypothetical protein [Streptomyces sp. NPDC059080]|uniref:hypothetical protein n=1 Tax=Streptomyces sp. NPDC059080 TaxID=3346718 RepID=UPI0036C7304D
MNNPPPPSTKSHPHTHPPHLAEPSRTPSGSGAPKNVARRASSSCPDPHPGDGRHPIAWLRITAPRGATPTARSVCVCGRDLFAAGHTKVHALISDHTTHRDTCPQRPHHERETA